MGLKEIKKSQSDFRKIVSDIRSNIFRPFYLMTGEEPYYSDIITEEILQRALEPHEKDFNQVVLYGSDSSAGAVVELARRFPMMASRQVVVVKEAQQLDKFDDLRHYFANPSPTTILVVTVNGKSPDKRTQLYTLAKKNGCIFESYPLYQDMVISWIEEYLGEKGVKIVPEAALLIAEHTGTELRKLVQELNKIITNLSEDNKYIDLAVVEENTGISREYNVFELTKAISFKDGGKAFRIVRKFAASPKQNPLVMTLAALFSHFSRILKYHTLINENRNAGRGEVSTAIGVNPYFLSEYERASRNYPLIKCMEAIAHIRRYDSVSKSSERGESSDGELLAELVFRIMN